MATKNKIEKDLKKAAVKIEKKTGEAKLTPARIKPISEEKKEDINNILKKVLK